MTIKSPQPNPKTWLIFEHETGAVDGIYFENPINDQLETLRSWQQRRPQHHHSILYLAEGSTLDTFDCIFLSDLYFDERSER